MIVWAGLLVALASSLVASASKIKFPDEGSAECKKFLGDNRFPLMTASLSVLGFVVAALGVHESRIKAAEERRQLSDRNEMLQFLILNDKVVSPAIRFTWETDDSRIGEDAVEEEHHWHESRDQTELPRAIGFFSTKVRSHLFPNARRDDVFGYVGAVEVRTGSPAFRPMFRVRKDGTVRNAGQRLSQVQRVIMIYYQESLAGFEVSMGERLDAELVFESLVSAHRKNITPLIVHAYGVDDSSRIADQLSPDFRKLSGKLTFFLDERKTFGITSMLRGRSVSAHKSSLVFEWEFVERPYVDRYSSDGRK